MRELRQLPPIASVRKTVKRTARRLVPAQVRYARRVTKRRRRRLKSLKTIRENAKYYSSIVEYRDDFRVALYFADTARNLYQIRQWFGPLIELNKHVRVILIIRNPNVAMKLRQETNLPIFFGRTIGQIEQMLSIQKIDAVLYVNQNVRNFQMMRFNSPAHVFICHGESEKAYMWSNQLKAYDFVFSAGQAARERLDSHLVNYDVGTRTYLVGRPQIDVEYEAPVELNPEFRTVLYAPTWEGDRPSMNYGSVSTHGLDLVRQIVESGEFNLIVRPHPRSGINDRQYRRDLNEIRRYLMEAQREDGPILYFDRSSQWGWQWGKADLCVSDVSAIAYDWMATGKPLLITQPVAPHAVLSDSPALMHVPTLSAGPECEDFVQTARVLVEHGPDGSYESLVDYYFGDTSSGASMQRFIDASLDVMKQRAPLREGHETGEEALEMSYPEDDE